MTKKEYDYIDGIIYSTSDDKTKYNLLKDDDCKDLTAYLNELINKNNEDNQEISRLCRTIAVCHEDIRDLSKNLDKEQKLKITYRDLSEYLSEAIREMDK